MSPIDKPDAVAETMRQQWLATRLGRRIALTWTDNRTSIISITRSPLTGYQLRLHHMFQDAPEAVWQALVNYIQHKKHTDKKVLQTYISRRQELIRQPPTQRQPESAIQAQGQHVDLDVIYRHLNQQYFNNRVQARITWMRIPLQRKRTSIRFGVYDSNQKVIRIHRLLDQPFVPRYFIESVVFHEMLHQLIPARHIRGRWRGHPPAFKQAERAYSHYQKAQMWERNNLHRLLK